MRALPLLILLALLGCQRAAAERSEDKPAPASSDEPASAAKPPPAACDAPHLPQTGLPKGTVVVETGAPEPVRLDVELCLSARQRQLGMMCRTAIGDDEGMLFVFPRMRTRSFWMKNTLIPLDMVFLDDEGRIVGVVENAEPLTLSSRRVPHPAQYVLEVGAGRARELGLKEGQWARFGGLPEGVGSPAVRLKAPGDKPAKAK